MAELSNLVDLFTDANGFLMRLGVHFEHTASGDSL